MYINKPLRKNALFVYIFLVGFIFVIPLDLSKRLSLKHTLTEILPEYVHL